MSWNGLEESFFPNSFISKSFCRVAGSFIYDSAHDSFLIEAEHMIKPAEVPAGHIPVDKLMTPQPRNSFILPGTMKTKEMSTGLKGLYLSICFVLGL